MFFIKKMQMSIEIILYQNHSLVLYNAAKK